MRHDSLARLKLLLALIGLGLGLGIALSWRLWTTDRDFPYFPVSDAIPQFNGALGSVFIFALLLALLANAHVASQKLTVAIILSFLYLCLQDQMRWQPWVYQYLLMLLPFAFVSVRSGQEAHRSILGLCRLVIVAVYLWGGIHKCHAGFISVYQNSLAKPILDAIDSPFLISFVTTIGYAIPPIEILIALSLLFRPTRNLAVLGAIGTHVIILILLGPAKGYISNSVVWPWNIAMCGMVVLLFRNTERLDVFRFPRHARLKTAGTAIATLLFACPILFYFSKWDRYLSFNLYSGRQKQMIVKVDSNTIEQVPQAWRPYLVDTNASDGHRILPISSWTQGELNVPLISEWRILRSLSRQLCQQVPGEPALVFYIDYRHLPEKPKRFFTCKQIDLIRD